MRLNRFIFLGIASTVLYGCGKDSTGVNAPPPNATVRYINALNDTGSVDIAMIDQVEWSAYAKPLAFRAGSAYQVTDATHPRHIRVFPTSTNAAVTSQIIDDETITFTPGSRVTLLLTGSARAGTAHFVMINDDIAPPPAGQIAIRAVNASTGAIDAYVVPRTSTAISGTPSFANVAPLATSAYITRTAIPTNAAGAATDTVAVRATAAGSTTVAASAQGPAAPSSLPGDVFPAAGVNSQNSKFSVYYFPAGVPGSPQNAVTTAGLVWFVDRNPCDPGVAC
ncbi:MAG TPA: DUF4397 domain-containing protein [Gemmatimonadaceae bacterium]|nr:DUF4397 domain-containing protein [Gemmatimonadaceae bacterium]